MKILFLVPYPLEEAPSQRFRFEQYFKTLTDNHISFTVQCFLDSQNWQSIYNNGNMAEKLWILLSGFFRRIAILPKSLSVDFVFIHREATPVGPPVIEWIIAKVFQKKIIYDFDDAIWTTDKKNESAVEKLIRWRSKVKSICKWSHKISCGNEYLTGYAQQHNCHVILNPTTVDTVALLNPSLHKKEANQVVTIGWTGSRSTLKYLNPLVPILQKLEVNYRIRFLVIADKKPPLDVKSLHFSPWSKKTEAEDLMQMDIGLMPLPDDEWSRGKCGFKILQYMAMGIPAVASPVGVNTSIIKDGNNGFLCSTEDEWYSRLELLIQNEEKRKLLGRAGRIQVEKYYSVSSNASNYLSLFD